MLYTILLATITYLSLGAVCVTLISTAHLELFRENEDSIIFSLVFLERTSYKNSSKKSFAVTIARIDEWWVVLPSLLLGGGWTVMKCFNGWVSNVTAGRSAAVVQWFCSRCGRCFLSLSSLVTGQLLLCWPSVAVRSPRTWWND